MDPHRVRETALLGWIMSAAAEELACLVVSPALYRLSGTVWEEFG
jgi:hypothetical protein